MAIKSGLGKLSLRDAAGRPFTAKQFMLAMVQGLPLSALPLEFEDLAGIEALPLHHKDPFDRLLAVQATRRGLRILSADPCFDSYAVPRVW
jgi:PIN domain nuclease of toxin-antitoxin system